MNRILSLLRRWFVAPALVVLSLAAVTQPAFAHSASTAYLQVGAATSASEASASESSPSSSPLLWRVALRDLDARLDLDANADGQLTWAEVEDRTSDIQTLALASIALSSADGRVCALAFDPLGFERLDDTGFARIAARADCAGTLPAKVVYGFMVRLDPSHRVLLTTPASTAPRLLAPGAEAALALAGGATAAGEPTDTGFTAMFLDGVGHILGGPDHLLFIVALLLPAVLVRKTNRWAAREQLRPALIQVAGIATAFTIAHSITLGLASFHVVRVSASIIEPLIAVTVLATALNNLKPIVTSRFALCAFAFGLIHGFGFAEVLAPLSLPSGELAIALLAFNLGVEGGQLIIIVIAFALLAVVRHWRGYPRWVLGAGSSALVLIACGWIVERVFDVPVFDLVAFNGS